MKSSKITEEYIISLAEKYFSTSHTHHKNIVKGIGDDTAVLKTEPCYQLFTSDILIEGTHFLFDGISPYDLGWKSIAVNISDIAAMGGKPTFAVLSLGLNQKVSPEWLENFYKGMADCCLKYSTIVVGGDTVYSAHSLVINLALLGETIKPVYRSKALPGFVLASTGELGASAAGFWVMQNCQPPFSEAETYCLNKHTLPVPRVEEANFISSRIKDLAMIDCSDGLYASCKTLCQQSGSGLELMADNFPLSPDLKLISEKAGKDPLDFILYGGEDYELLIAMPATDFATIREKYLDFFKTELFCLGEFNKKPNEIFLQDKKGKRRLVDKSFKHFGDKAF